MTSEALGVCRFGNEVLPRDVLGHQRVKYTSDHWKCLIVLCAVFFRETYEENFLSGGLFRYVVQHTNYDWWDITQAWRHGRDGNSDIYTKSSAISGGHIFNPRGVHGGFVWHVASTITVAMTNYKRGVTFACLIAGRNKWCLLLIGLHCFFGDNGNNFTEFLDFVKGVI